MSEEKIETKKKEKSVLKNLGMTALAVGGVLLTVVKELNKKISCEGSFEPCNLMLLLTVEKVKTKLQKFIKNFK